jgi:hypothetical protein
LFTRLRNGRYIVMVFTSQDGAAWTKFDIRIKTAGHHHNVAYDFLNLSPAIHAFGAGEARFKGLVCYFL